MLTFEPRLTSFASRRAFRLRCLTSNLTNHTYSISIVQFSELRWFEATPFDQNNTKAVTGVAGVLSGVPRREQLQVTMPRSVTCSTPSAKQGPEENVSTRPHHEKAMGSVNVSTYKSRKQFQGLVSRGHITCCQCAKIPPAGRARRCLRVRCTWAHNMLPVRQNPSPGLGTPCGRTGQTMTSLQ